MEVRQMLPGEKEVRGRIFEKLYYLTTQRHIHLRISEQIHGKPELHRDRAEGGCEKRLPVIKNHALQKSQIVDDGRVSTHFTISDSSKKDRRYSPVDSGSYDDVFVSPNPLFLEGLDHCFSLITITVFNVIPV